MLRSDEELNNKALYSELYPSSALRAMAIAKSVPFPAVPHGLEIRGSPAEGSPQAALPWGDVFRV
jgi:hypothetical protein